MIIGIDGNEANVGKRVGISEYAFELLTQFSNSKFKIQNSKYIIYLKDKPRGDLPKETVNWEYRIVKPAKFWTQIGLPLDLYINKPRPDIFFTPTHYAPRFSPVPTIISIMDMSFVHFPELFKKSDLYQLKNWTAYSAKKASKIFTISQTSKNDIIKQYGLSKDKVIVTYPGIKMNLLVQKNEAMEKKQLFNKYRINKNYILFVGTIQPRKNIARLIEAFSKVLNKNRDLDLVIIGKKGWLYEDILQTPEKFQIKDKVKFLEFVSDEDLKTFYQNAICFILPSLYEGFGLPVLEAMANGCPVITSNVSSLPEAGGNAVLYCNPTDVDNIASKINLLITDGKLRKELVKKGYKQIKNFSWEKTAKKTLEVLEELARNRH